EHRERVIHLVARGGLEDLERPRGEPRPQTMCRERTRTDGDRSIDRSGRDEQPLHAQRAQGGGLSDFTRCSRNSVSRGGTFWRAGYTAWTSLGGVFHSGST